MTLDAKSHKGSSLTLQRFDGKLFELASHEPYAPGQPLTLELLVGTGVTLELKSIGSIKQPDGTFTVRARATTLSKQARDALDRHFPR